jgi:hypothetical protein
MSTFCFSSQILLIQDFTPQRPESLMTRRIAIARVQIAYTDEAYELTVDIGIAFQRRKQAAFDDHFWHDATVSLARPRLGHLCGWINDPHSMAGFSLSVWHPDHYARQPPQSGKNRVYATVIIFGKIRVLEDDEEKRRALYGLISEYFPDMQPGQEYRPITDDELRRTSVYAIAIESWSGKRNWADQAEQSDEWPRLKV